jgi:hypothetical protein
MALRRAAAAKSSAHHGPRLCHVEPQPHGGGQMLPHFVEILAEMAGNSFPRGEHGKHVDEAEHLHLHRLVLHGPGHDAVIPPAALQHVGTAAVELAEDFAADFARHAVDRRQVALSEVIHQLRHRGILRGLPWPSSCGVA